MVAFNFSVFVDKVEAREKRMTIRKKQRAKKGDSIQLYTGMRTKDCRKLVEEDAVCLGSCPVEISENIIQCYTNLFGIEQWIHQREEDFAKMDGFETFEDMKSFFKQHYGLPFTGYMHQWHWPEPPTPSSI